MTSSTFQHLYQTSAYQQPREYQQQPREYQQQPREYQQQPREYQQQPREYQQQPREYQQQPREYQQQPREYQQTRDYHSRELSQDSNHSNSNPSSLATPIPLSPNSLPDVLPSVHDFMKHYYAQEPTLIPLNFTIMTDPLTNTNELNNPELSPLTVDETTNLDLLSPLNSPGLIYDYGSSPAANEVTVAMRMAKDLLLQAKLMADKVIGLEGQVASFEIAISQKELEVTTLQSKCNDLLNTQELTLNQVENLKSQLNHLNQQLTGSPITTPNHYNLSEDNSLNHSIKPHNQESQPQIQLILSPASTPESQSIKSINSNSPSTTNNNNHSQTRRLLSPHRKSHSLGSRVKSPGIIDINNHQFDSGHWGLFDQTFTIHESKLESHKESVLIQIPVHLLQKANAQELYEFCLKTYSQIQLDKTSQLLSPKHTRNHSGTSFLSGSDDSSYLTALSFTSNEGYPAQDKESYPQLNNPESSTESSSKLQVDHTPKVTFQVNWDSNPNSPVNHRSILRRLSEPSVGSVSSESASDSETNRSIHELFSPSVNRSAPSLISHCSLTSSQFQEPPNTPCDSRTENHSRKSQQSQVPVETTLPLELPNLDPSPSVVGNLTHKATDSNTSSIEPTLDISSAIQRVMAGEFFYKSSRTFMGQEKRHLRFMWVNPQSKELYWSVVDPGTQRTLMMDRSHPHHSAKSAVIRSIRLVSDPWSPSELIEGPNQGIASHPSPITPQNHWIAHHNQLPILSIILQTASRDIKIKARNIASHRAWEAALLCLQTSAPVAFTWNGSPSVRMRGDNLLHLTTSPSTPALTTGYPRVTIPSTRPAKGTPLLPPKSLPTPSKSVTPAPVTPTLPLDKLHHLLLPTTTTPRPHRRKLRLYPTTTTTTTSSLPC